MELRLRRVTGFALVAALISTSGLIAADKHKKKTATGMPQMDDSKRALHALNRLTFGARPGEAERVASMGVDKWFEQQLHPEKIDDHALDARLAGFRTLNMDAKTMFQTFPPPQVAKMVEKGRVSVPRDPEKRAVYEAMMAKYDAKQEKKQDAANQNAQANANGQANNNGNDQADQDAIKRQRQQERREARQAEAPTIDRLNSESPDKRYQDILRMSPEERTRVLQALNPEERQAWMSDFTPQQKEEVQALQNPQGVVVGELQQAKILRAAYSERQLEEVMTDFWFNHLNVFIGKNLDRYYVTQYEQQTIRPRALGKFKDLLIATAKSPAMLLYLDNAESIGPHSMAAEGQVRRANYRMRRGPFGIPETVPVQRPQNQQQQKKRAAGLNENYGRELMELHTLGVDGGYTQKDVTEAAKVLTGWTVKQPRDGGSFDFEERRHEPGEKVVLGHKFKENGEKEGLDLLEMLAHHPSTAHFISKKLAIRFVSDDPPESLVRKMADTFLKSDGDIREVLRTMFYAPEFWSPEAYRAKIKTPLEFVISAIRSTGAEVDNAMPLVQTMNRMGMPLYQMQPPTGYSAKNDAWQSTSALLNRINFALALGSNKLPGVKVDTNTMLGSAEPPDAQATVAALEHSLLAGDVSDKTHATIMKQIDGSQVNGGGTAEQRQPNAGMIAALILGSPEFQKR